MTAKTATATTAPAKPAKAAPAMKLLKGVKDIEAAFVSISRRGGSLQSDIHVALCSVLHHVAEHSDIRLITVAINSLPDMVRKQAVAKWFTAFGPVEVDGDDVTFVRGKPTRLAAAQAEPFYSFNPKLDYVPLTPDAIASSLEKLQKRLKLDAKKTGTDHSALIAGLAKLKPANAVAA